GGIGDHGLSLRGDTGQFLFKCVAGDGLCLMFLAKVLESLFQVGCRFSLAIELAFQMGAELLVSSPEQTGE
ncbi:hypothetical protein OAE15_01495, partial [Verrucomicrobiales bacterium]|nr:hypothetical protein [Verrucomicrobiales bacterium]